MASEPKVGDVRQDGSLRQQVWLGSGWYYVGSPIATKLVSAELSAAREMREVLREVGSGVIVSPASVRLLDCCPLCQGPRVTHHREEGKVHSKIDHAPDCRLARLIGGDRG